MTAVGAFVDYDGHGKPRNENKNKRQQHTSILHRHVSEVGCFQELHKKGISRASGVWRDGRSR
jgi:hypothetical protein